MSDHRFCRWRPCPRLRSKFSMKQLRNQYCFYRGWVISNTWQMEYHFMIGMTTFCPNPIIPYCKNAFKENPWWTRK
eukprot:scaffold3923_cov122-Chaetoceros_neogracile.AAC.2